MIWSLIYVSDKSCSLQSMTVVLRADKVLLYWLIFVLRHRGKSKGDGWQDLTSGWPIASTMSSSLSGSVVKKLEWVLIMVFCTASFAQLYKWILAWELGIFIILVKTSQSIWNFLNCCGGHLKVEVRAPGYQCLNSGLPGWWLSLACLKRHSASPINMTPNSFSIDRSSIWRLSIVSF